MKGTAIEINAVLGRRLTCKHQITYEGHLDEMPAGFQPSAPADTTDILQYEGKTTVYVVIVCLVAASGGALFGYDLGITGAA